MQFSVEAFPSLIISLVTSNVFFQISILFVLSFILFITLRKYFINKSPHKNLISPCIDALIGKDGIVLKTIEKNEIGKVKLDGEIWSAIALDSAYIEKGATVIIEEIRGLRLIVRKKV